VAPPNYFDHWVQPRGRQQRALIEHSQVAANAALNEANSIRAALIAAQAEAASARTAERELCAHLRREREERRALTAKLESERRALTAKLESVEAASRQHRTEIDIFLASRSWRITSPLRAVVRSTRLQRERLKLIRRALAPSGRKERIVIAQSVRRRFQPPARTPQADASQKLGGGDELSYERWIARFDQLRPLDKKAIKRHVSSGALPTLLVLASFDTF
jgi:hypothetical protein